MKSVFKDERRFHELHFDYRHLGRIEYHDCKARLLSNVSFVKMCSNKPFVPSFSTILTLGNIIRKHFSFSLSDKAALSLIRILIRSVKEEKEQSKIVQERQEILFVVVGGCCGCESDRRWIRQVLLEFVFVKRERLLHYVWWGS